MLQKKGGNGYMLYHFIFCEDIFCFLYFNLIIYVLIRYLLFAHFPLHELGHSKETLVKRINKKMRTPS